MGDQKDHMTIQKKDVEHAGQEVETQNFDTATESLDPPSLQLKAEESQEKEEGGESEKESGGAFQFALGAPPDKPEETPSRAFGADTIQGKGIAEPFKIPIVQKKEVSPQTERSSDKPSFKL